MNPWFIGAALLVGGLVLTRPKPSATSPPKKPPIKPGGATESARYPQGRLVGTIPSARYSAAYDKDIQEVENLVSPQFQVAGTPTLSRAFFAGGGAGSAAARQANITQPAKGTNAEAQRLKGLGKLIVIESSGDLTNVARMFAAAIIIQAKGGKTPFPQSLRGYLRQAKETVRMDEQYKMSLCKGLAKRLARIGGISTTTPPWVPQNQGIFREGLNKYTVPRKLEKDLLVELLKFHPLEFCLELAIIEALDVTMREMRGETNPIAKLVSGLSKVVGKGVANGTAGATAGPWGAVVGFLQGAIEEAGKLLFAALVEATEKIGKEAQVFGRLERGIREVQGFTKTDKIPLRELGYGMNIPNTDVPSWLPVPSPFNLFFQRAAQLAVFQFVAQGVYPAPGMYAWAPFLGSTMYALTTDAADDMRASDAWDRSLKSKP